MSEEINFSHQKLKGLSTTEEKGRLIKRDTKVNGLRIRVYPSGTKTFYLKKRLKPKHGNEEIVHKIGRFPDIGLADARTKARELLNEIEKGQDPRKEDIASEKSFGEIAEDYLNNYAETLAEKTRKQYRRIINNHLGKEADSDHNFSQKAPENITPKDVEKLMNSVADNAERSKHSTVPEELQGHRMANCVRKVINSIFSNTTGLEIDSPAKKVRKKKEQGKRRNPLSDEQIRTLWKNLKNKDPVMENYFKMLLTLGQRKTETARMEWENIEGDLWKVPPKETKNNEWHLVPLPSLAQKLLDKLEEINGNEKWVFCSPHNRNDGPINGMSKPVKRIREQCGFSKDDFRIHDLRATVVTNMGDLGVKANTKKRVVNQSIGDVADKHYDAHEYLSEKREALKRWQRRLADIVGLDVKTLKQKSSANLRDRIQNLVDVLEESDLQSNIQEKIDPQLDTISAQLSTDEPSEIIIEECQKKIRQILEDEVGEEKADELIFHP